MASRIRALLPMRIRQKLPQEVGVVEISASESMRLNRQYRKKRKPANVLSFRYSDAYGEILLCPEVIRREALENTGKVLKNTVSPEQSRGNARVKGHLFVIHMTWMIVHGMLHIAGVHHELSETEDRRSRAIEKDIVRKIFPKASLDFLSF